MPEYTEISERAQDSSSSSCRVACTYISAFGVVLSIILLVAAAIFVPPAVSSYIQEQIRLEVVVDSENSKSFNIWQDTRSPNVPQIYMRFYMFNITNTEEILAGGKPNLQQIGPYSYRENRVKFNYTFAEDGNSVKFWQWEFLVFDQNTSAPGLDPLTDNITTVSLGYQAIRAIIGVDAAFDILVDFIVDHFNETIFKHSTPNNIIFGGPDPLLSWPVTRHAIPNLPETIALQPNQTDTSDGQTPDTYSIQLTGKNDISLIHQYAVWHGNTSLTLWGSAEANQVKGTDGFFFPPGMNKSEPLLIWVDQISRNGYVEYNDSIELMGIDLFRYVLSPWQMLNSSYVPGNAAYYQLGMPNGMFNLSAVFWNAPIFVTKPHFLDADPCYLQTVTGLSPNRTLHDSFLCAEPTTGVVLYAWRRLMITTYIEPLKGWLNNITPAYLPFVWVEEGAEMSPEFAKTVRDKVDLAKAAQNYPIWVFSSLAGFLTLMLVVGALVIVLRPHEKEGECIISERSPLVHRVEA